MKANIELQPSPSVLIVTRHAQHLEYIISKTSL